MEMIDFFWGDLVFVTTFFSVGYIITRRGANKLFFLSSCIGFYVLIQLLLSALVSPVYIFLVMVVPELAGQGLLTYILPLLYLANFIQEWSYLVVHPVLAIWLPLAIYKRYKIFK